MLKQLLNECRVDLLIRTDGPLLVKSGLDRVTGPKMTFVRVPRNGREEVYLPGSTLKGAFRAQAERIARTLLPATAQDRCCDPLAQPCSARWSSVGARPDGPTAYSGSCLICRLFGSTVMAGRLAFRDAYLDGVEERLPHQRESIEIDRVTGGAYSGAIFDLEAVTEATFRTTLHLRNFELWQLGLLAFVLADLAEGYLRIGYGKSRGFGAVQGAVEQVSVHYLGPNSPPDGSLRGLAAMLPNAAYGFSAAETADVPLQAADGPAVALTADPLGLRRTYRFTTEQAAGLWRSVAPVWLAEAGDAVGAGR